MPTTLTLKNIPDELYVRLKASAESHRRWASHAEEVITSARAIRDALPKDKFTAKNIDALKREGRP